MLLAPRYLPRLAAMVGLFTKYGLKDFARKQGLLELAPHEDDPHAGGDDAITARATAFKHRLVELGPAYVKLGQVLSTRPDLIPPAYITALESLQDDVGPVPFADIEEAVQEQLGARISKLFSSFDDKPLGILEKIGMGFGHA